LLERLVDEAADSFFEARNIKVEEEAQRFFSESKIGEQLGLVEVFDFLDCF